MPRHKARPCPGCGHSYEMPEQTLCDYCNDTLIIGRKARQASMEALKAGEKITVALGDSWRVARGLPHLDFAGKHDLILRIISREIAALYPGEYEVLCPTCRGQDPTCEDCDGTGSIWYEYGEPSGDVWMTADTFIGL